ncbi:hypothetical protein AC1031_005369 [Aphanomyces cochlioides]|nr:hypothetical protein AC1031_005369 [Aphanomyces cochlioides]
MQLWWARTVGKPIGIVAAFFSVELQLANQANGRRHTQLLVSAFSLSGRQLFQRLQHTLRHSKGLCSSEWIRHTAQIFSCRKFIECRHLVHEEFPLIESLSLVLGCNINCLYFAKWWVFSCRVAIPPERPSGCNIDTRK